MFKRVQSGLTATLLAGLLISPLAGCDWMKKKDAPNAKSAAQIAAEQKRKLQAACGSNATYERIKEVVFDEAIRVRNADPANLDTLATHSVVRMENPVVKSRDEELNVTVCTGRFVLELPPGAERGFEGQRRLVYDIEYAAQAAADGSGLVYQIKGAEPIIYKLAAFDLSGQRYVPPATERSDQYADAVPVAPPSDMEDDMPASPPPITRPAPPRPAPPVARPAPPLPKPRPAPEPVRATAQAKPSFNCRFAKTRSEKMVCSNNRLAALDRSMSSLYYSALSDADARTRAELRRTRDRFLSSRERCGSEGCVAEIYQGRMYEIRDIMRGSD